MVPRTDDSFLTSPFSLILIFIKKMRVEGEKSISQFKLTKNLLEIDKYNLFFINFGKMRKGVLNDS